MKTEFKVNIKLSGKHIRLMQEANDSPIYGRYTKRIEYLENKGLVFVEISEYTSETYSVKLTKLGKNILAEVQSSEWKMQPGFVVTQKHIDVLKYMLENKYMSKSEAQYREFDVMEDMTGEAAPLPFFQHVGVGGGWGFVKYDDDTYPLEEAKNLIRRWERNRPKLY